MSENKVQFNLKNVHYAKLTSGVFATPVAIPGAVSLSLSPEGDTTEFYADGVLYYKNDSNNGYSGDLEIAKVPEAMLADIWGFTADSNDVIVENATAVASPFALLFEIDGDAQASKYAVYNCTAKRPNIASKTNEKSKDVQTQSLALTAIPLADGKVQCRTTDETPAATLNGWYTTVYTGPTQQQQTP